MDLLQKISVISFVTLGRSSTNLWKPHQSQKRKKFPGAMDWSLAQGLSPYSTSLPPPFYLLPSISPSALQSVLALLKVLLTCNDLGERNALKNVTREWTKCQQKVTLYSTVTAISIYPATTISLCCKFNKLSERLKQCLCVYLCCVCVCR